MLQDNRVMAAITSIVQRSEKQTDADKLRTAYVDAGILPLLENVNSQIVYGRRGTGKTHLLKVLALSDRWKLRRTSIVYIDTRTLGSSEQFTDPTLQLGLRCFSLFQDISLEIARALRKEIFSDSGEGDFASAVRWLDEFERLLTEPIAKATKKSEARSRRAKMVSEDQLGFNLGIRNLDLKADLKSNKSAEGSISEEFDFSQSDKVVFPELQGALREVLSALDLDLLVLIDEWQQIPRDLQPYLAEFIKRAFFPISNVVFKIAALEYRSSFGVPLTGGGGGALGFELGADISANLDIDDYYVLDREPKRVAELFADVLYRHLEFDFGSYLFDQYEVCNGEGLIREMFASEDAFRELVRAAEGVVRDLINIFSKSAANARARGRKTIDRQAVTRAAQEWFESDKVKELPGDLVQLLLRIVSEVIGRRKARTFMLRRDLEKHESIQRLFDARVLHVVRRGYADKDNPGARYNIYSIDYGAYVDLLSTMKAPEPDFVEEPEEGERDNLIVPFDDKRTIRRIIVTEEILVNAELPTSQG